MTHYRQSLTALFIMLFSFAAQISAQENRIFTLEELIPGGKEYDQYVPRIAATYQWQGDRLMVTENDSVWELINPAGKSRKKLQCTFAGISGTPGVKEQRVNHLTFTNKEETVVLTTDSGIGTYDLKHKTVLTFFSYPEKSENHSLSPSGQHLAYTKANNLYLLDSKEKEHAVTNESDRAIVCGQPVHRNEFGISKGIFWSPDGNKVAFYRMDERMVSDYPLVDASARIAVVKPEKYPMAGMTSHQVTIGIHDIRDRKTTWLKTGEPAEQYLTNIAWSPDGEDLYVAHLNRSQETMQLKRYNSTTGEEELMLFSETHPKYVEPENPVLFVRGNQDRFIWQSERNGYNHLYLYDTNGNLLKQLTDGSWEVTEITGFDEKGENLYFLSTLPSPIDRHICSVNLKSGKITQHTTLPGIHTARLSNSGRYLIDHHRAHDNPGRIDLMDSRTGKIALLNRADNPFTGYRMPTVDVGTLKAADGVTDLWYRMVKPADFDPTKKYPVVIYVYGGPHSQMVNNRWRYGSGGWETHMAQKGYILFVMDNRGTAFRGVAFEQVTHRRLGTIEAEDQMKGVEYLRSLPYIDSERMGIHGWSYGGFMTINMLLRYPDLFRVGVAGGPVIDWKYYEVMYGERYMDTPRENPEGYEESSLLNRAGKLKARLLIIHGDEDPTVVLQNTLQFLKASIKAGTHPDLFLYPGHGHNMIGHDRVHLHEHITRYFEDFIDRNNP
ncbi:MAG: ptpA [Proteiniphilum sp.]|nr:ptpA [Proteiniphilum sp.]